MVTNAKLSRWIRSIPQTAAIFWITCLLSGIGYIFRAVYGPTAGPGANMISWVIAGLALSFIFIAIQTYLNYQREVHDPTWAIKYEEKWDSPEMEKNRHFAGKAIFDNLLNLADLEHRKTVLEPIDLVLDFLDTIGFLLKGHQMSEEVVRHYFYYWIRGYWLTCRPYIEAWQNVRGESRRWENIKECFETIDGDSIPEKQLMDFLDEEIGMWSPPKGQN